MKRLLYFILALMLIPSGMAHAQGQDAFFSYGVPSPSAVLVVLVNGTDHAITSVRIVGARAGDEAASDLLQGSVIAPGERFGLWIEERWQVEGKALLLGFEAGVSRKLYIAGVKDFAQAVIRLDVNVAFLVYTSLSTGEEISTWRDALKRLEMEESIDFPLPREAKPLRTDEKDRQS